MTPKVVKVAVPGPPRVVKVDTGGRIQVFKTAVTGPQGPPGKDPWLDPVQVLSAAGALEIDYRLGKHVRLTVTGDLAISVIGWPADPAVARLTLEIDNSAGGAITLPAGHLTQSGNAIPLGTGRHWVVLATSDGGATVFAAPAGIFLSPAP
jgi:hypothetical protein